jgi:PncC family amidohydrolase
MVFASGLSLSVSFSDLRGKNHDHANVLIRNRVPLCWWLAYIIIIHMSEALEVIVGELLRAHGWRLAVAESCTGGLIGHRLTNIPGASTYYMGSITAYAYEAKVRLLGVKWATLEKEGAVSEPVVLEMARGVRRALAADVGLSVSGIAGPGGGTVDKPIGLTCIGLSVPDIEQAWEFIWQGDRLQIKEQSAEQALQLLVDFLRSIRDGHD